MALIHRVNINFGFVLNTFYCKCIVNIKRCKTEYNIKSQTNVKYGENITFGDMLKFRQTQAKKSVLIGVPENYIYDMEKYCLKHVNIKKILFYNTETNRCFVLMELMTEKDVEIFRNMASCKINSNAHSVTPLFLYKVRNSSYNKPMTKKSIMFKPPNFDQIKESLKNKNTISEQMIILHHLLKITDLDIRLRFFTAEQISYYLSRLFMNVSVIPFGSSVNGFGQIGCDLDLLCKTDISNIINSSTRKFFYMSQPLHLADRNEQKEFLDAISTIMKICIPGIDNIKKILEARVPIIKFFNQTTNMHCDLSSTNVIALHMSELLYTYGELDWRVKPLICTIRKWARNTNITKDISGQWITNFSLTLLILFYLQIKNILPSLKVIKYHIKNSRRSWSNDWKNSINYNNDSLHNLLYGFFEYYSIFDFKMQAICIKEGKPRVKKDSSPLYIYNPFDESLNVSKNITIFELTRLIDHFRKALQILIETSEKDAIIKLIKINSISSNSIEMDDCKDIEKSTEIDNIEKDSDTFNQKESLNESINKINVNVLETMEKNIIK